MIKQKSNISKTKFSSVSEYISIFPKNIQEILEELRSIIKSAAPQAEETISYNMPALKFNGILVYYAACKIHIGFYPTASPMIAFRDELAAFKTTKGSIHFPIDCEIPKDLVIKIVKYRLNENMAKTAR